MGDRCVASVFCLKNFTGKTRLHRCRALISHDFLPPGKHATWMSESVSESLVHACVPSLTAVRSGVWLLLHWLGYFGYGWSFLLLSWLFGFAISSLFVRFFYLSILLSYSIIYFGKLVNRSLLSFYLLIYYRKPVVAGKIFVFFSEFTCDLLRTYFVDLFVDANKKKKQVRIKTLIFY